VISADHASKLLEHVVYEQVLECIDLDALYELEQALWYALSDCGVPAETIGDIAHDLITKALDQVSGDERRELTMGIPGTDCDLCEQEARAHARAAATRARSSGGPS
jgi:hypothetical protein